jgi:hypothetical protein
LSESYPDVADDEKPISENNDESLIMYKIVMHMLIARQRFGKHIPEFALSTTGHPSLGNGPTNTHS